MIHETEPPPSPILPREGRSRVHLGLRRGGSSIFIIINHPPSRISWRSLLEVSNSFVGSLVGEELDEIHHARVSFVRARSLVSTMFLDWCCYDFAMLMLVTLGPGAMNSDLNRLWIHHYIHVLDPILQVIVTYYGYDPTTPEWQQLSPLLVMTVVWGVHVFTMC